MELCEGEMRRYSHPVDSQSARCTGSESFVQPVSPVYSQPVSQMYSQSIRCTASLALKLHDASCLALEVSWVRVVQSSLVGLRSKGAVNNRGHLCWIGCKRKIHQIQRPDGVLDVQDQNIGHADSFWNSVSELASE